jgi:hypothetical protein
VVADSGSSGIPPGSSWASLFIIILFEHRGSLDPWIPFRFKGHRQVNLTDV